MNKSENNEYILKNCIKKICDIIFWLIYSAIRLSGNMVNLTFQFMTPLDWSSGGVQNR